MRTVIPMNGYLYRFGRIDVLVHRDNDSPRKWIAENNDKVFATGKTKKEVVAKMTEKHGRMKYYGPEYDEV